MIDRKDIPMILYFEYAEMFFGSDAEHNVRYALAREPFEAVNYSNDPHKNDDAKIRATKWSEPFCYEVSDNKLSKDFDYSPEGIEEALCWIEEGL